MHDALCGAKIEAVAAYVFGAGVAECVDGVFGVDERGAQEAVFEVCVEFVSVVCAEVWGCIGGAAGAYESGAFEAVLWVCAGDGGGAAGAFCGWACAAALRGRGRVDGGVGGALERGGGCCSKSHFPVWMRLERIESNRIESN